MSSSESTLLNIVSKTRDTVLDALFEENKDNLNSTFDTVMWLMNNGAESASGVDVVQEIKQGGTSKAACQGCACKAGAIESNARQYVEKRRAAATHDETSHRQRRSDHVTSTEEDSRRIRDGDSKVRQRLDGKNNS